MYELFKVQFANQQLRSFWLPVVPLLFIVKSYKFHKLLKFILNQLFQLLNLIRIKGDFFYLYANEQKIM